ncbi:hypothetical protein [Neolewinella persica]|uniref:hypothetical protein n=1 Tax=Neolewinella persica TaxID=70998 RepID=UPI00035E5970|nr:hypothetical protein [Neolewinella persica]
MLRLVYLLPLLLLPILLQADCTPAFYGYQFLNPDLLEYDSKLGPIYQSFANRYRLEGNPDAIARERDNLAEWHERYCEQVEIADLKKLIYGETLGSLREILRVMDNKDNTSTALSSTLRKNSFARHLVDYRCTEVLTYLIFAKRVEPYTSRVAANFKRPETDRVAMERLINDGLDMFKSTESHYIRLRYSYQLLRLAHYLKEYAYVIELYDYLMPKVEANPSILYDWVESHRAGALQALGDNPRSAYIYSRVFERCPSKRESAYLSFKITSDAEWQAASNLCANDHERAMLHVMRAQNRRAVILEEMEKIYALEPANTALEPLVMRELLELERDLLGLNFNPNAQANKRQRNRPRPNAAKRLIALQAFVNNAVERKNTANPSLWLMAKGTLEMLSGDYFYARQSYQKLADQALEDTLANQVRILREVLNVLALNRINDSVELYYFDLLANDALRARYPDLRPLVNDKLEAVYRNTGRTGKAALLQYGFDALRMNPMLNHVKELEGMADSLLGNRFDKALLADRIGPTPEDDINDLLGTYYLQKGQWETAIEVFNRVDLGRQEAYGTYAPFIKQFKDRVNFRPSAAAVRYTKADLLARLLELEDEARRTDNDTIAARNFFNIGLAHYNMSYYSYNWQLADNFRSGSSGARAAAKQTRDWVFSHRDAPLGNRESMSMDRASYYFERALERAPGREAAAEAAFFAAKAQRNQHYAAGSPGQRPFTYFRLLKDAYYDTKFYQKAVEECRTFAWFVGR